MRPRYAIPTLTLMAVLPLTACTESSATTEERIVYLRQIARQGAETGNLLRDQEAPQIDKARCTRAFEGLTRREDYPSDMGGGVSKEWEAQIREFFVDSCVSGKPKETPEDLDSTTTTTRSTTTTTPETTTTVPEETTTTTTTTTVIEPTTTTTTR